MTKSSSFAVFSQRVVIFSKPDRLLECVQITLIIYLKNLKNKIKYLGDKQFLFRFALFFQKKMKQL